MAIAPDDLDVEIERDDDSAGDTLMVSVSITEPSGTSWTASAHVTPPVSDDALADMIVRAAGGAAAARGHGVWMALQRIIGGLDG